MKAILCKAFGPIADLEYADRPEPGVSGNTVLVKAEAVGVNFADGLLVQGLYQMKPQTPFVPGMEAAGTVAAIGPDVTAVKAGDRVACLVDHGAYAGMVAAPEGDIFPLPADMDFAAACALLCGYGTAHHALKQRACLKPRETLAVFGAAGGTGMAAVQVGRAMGARVLAVASTEEKRQIARDAGADEAFGYDDLASNLKSATGGRGIDVVFDPVGGAAFDAASRSMARNGRLLVVGFASGTIPRLPVNLALVKEYSATGVFWGNFRRYEPDVFADNMREMFAWYEAGDVRPVIGGRYPLSDAAAVLARLLGRGATGKIILLPDR